MTNNITANDPSFIIGNGGFPNPLYEFLIDEKKQILAKTRPLRNMNAKRIAVY